MTSKPSLTLQQLAAEIGGEIKADELLYGSAEHRIFISLQDDGDFFLASQQPLYAIKNGKARRVRAGTKGDDVGWYYATVGAEQVRTALDLARGLTDTEEHTVEFAYEHILRDYCAHNLSTIEDGLSLYDKEGVSGVEFPAGGRFIDILAVDATGGFVVFEFKLSRGYERVVGQLLRYIGWVRQHLATSRQQVRGIIVARHTTEDLRLATAGQADIKLMEYKLSITFSVA